MYKGDCKEVQIREGKIYSGKETFEIVMIISDIALRESMQGSIQYVMERYPRYPYHIKMVDADSFILDTSREPAVIIADLTSLSVTELELLARIKRKYKKSKCIVLAQDSNYIKYAFKIQAYRYIVKKDLKTELLEALEDTRKDLIDLQGLGVEINEVNQWIFYKDIYYMESLGDEVMIQMKDFNVTVRKTLHYLYNQLDECFYQCHKSYIINLEHIATIQENVVLLTTKQIVPVAVRRRNGLIKVYREYVKNTRC